MKLLRRESKVWLPSIHHKKGYLPLIKRGNISVKRDPKETRSQVTILLIKKELD
jgi:hypothetical protein